MEEKLGVKETKELLEGVLHLGLVLARALKDGVQIADAKAVLDALLKDEEVKEAVKGVKHIGAELKDLDLGEGLQLGKLLLDYVPKFLEAVKK